MSTISRRGFLVSVVGGGAALAIVVFRGGRNKRIVLELKDVLDYGPSTELIGKQYLKKTPAERDPALLTELIFSSFEWHAFLEADARILIRNRVTQDFAEDRVVRLGHWILSETETRLCALTFLAHNS